MIIINDVLFAIILGDIRALYSYDTGKYLYQITRNQKFPKWKKFFIIYD